MFLFLGFGDDDTGKEKASADDGDACEVASGPVGYGVTQTARSAANEMMSLAGERHCPGCASPRAEGSDSPWHFWFRRLSNLQMLHVCLFCMWYLSVREMSLSIKVFGTQHLWCWDSRRLLPDPHRTFCLVPQSMQCRAS